MYIVTLTTKPDLVLARAQKKLVLQYKQFLDMWGVPRLPISTSSCISLNRLHFLRFTVCYYMAHTYRGSQHIAQTTKIGIVNCKQKLLNKINIGKLPSDRDGEIKNHKYLASCI